MQKNTYQIRHYHISHQKGVRLPFQYSTAGALLQGGTHNGEKRVFYKNIHAAQR